MKAAKKLCLNNYLPQAQLSAISVINNQWFMAIIVSILYQELLVEIISSNRAQVFPPELTLCLFFNPFDWHKNITRSSAHSYFLQFIGITDKQIQTDLAQTSISTWRLYSVKQLIITWATVCVELVRLLHFDWVL